MLYLSPPVQFFSAKSRLLSAPYTGSPSRQSASAFSLLFLLLTSSFSAHSPTLEGVPQPHHRLRRRVDGYDTWRALLSYSHWLTLCWCVFLFSSFFSANFLFAVQSPRSITTLLANGTPRGAPTVTVISYAVGRPRHHMQWDARGTTRGGTPTTPHVLGCPWHHTRWNTHDTTGTPAARCATTPTAATQQT